MNTFHKIMFIALTTLYGSAQLLACTFIFFNDTDAKVLLIDAQEKEHMIAPNTQEEVVGAVEGNMIEISEFEQDSNRISAKYELYEEECAVDGESITTVRFSAIKDTTDGAWIITVPEQDESFEARKEYLMEPFSIEGSTMKFEVRRAF